jgi:ADP-ribosylglycohydrolase
MFGPEVTFPAGSYSDDTQLRLAVCRAIAGNGFFDVESFAKIELPVWLNYALGAGRASKLAATNLGLRDSTWSHNFFHSAQVEYWNGGGNGAAMRVHPHVWASHRDGPGAFIGDVIRDAVCTHGHPRALIGAAVHTHSLHMTLQTGRPPSPEEWAELGSIASAQAYQSLLDDQELSLVWIPQWEQLSGSKLKKLWETTTTEWLDASRSAGATCRSASSPYDKYRTVLSNLGGLSNAERGSGLKTPLYANVLAWIFRDEEPKGALITAANELGSDTDTIGTMAGALIGAFSSVEPHEPIQDAAYIASEARRLFAIGEGREQAGFAYPDLMSWSAPRTQTDAWIESDGEAALAGLGTLKTDGPEFSAPKGPGHIYQWCVLPFGQTVLAKRKKSARAKPRTAAVTHEDNRPSRASSPGFEKVSANAPEHAHADKGTAEPDLHARTRDCIRGGFDATRVGENLLALVNGPEGIERAIAFAAIIAKAKLARDQR